MELTFEQFKEVLEHYHFTFDDAEKAYTDFLANLKEPLELNFQVYMACMPQAVYPPATSFLILGDSFIEENKPQYGYFAIRRHFEKTTH